MEKHIDEQQNTMLQLQQKYMSLQKNHLLNEQAQMLINMMGRKMKTVKKNLEDLDIIKPFWINKVESITSSY